MTISELFRELHYSFWGSVDLILQFPRSLCRMQVQKMIPLRNFKNLLQFQLHDVVVFEF